MQQPVRAPEIGFVFVGGVLGTAARLGLDRWIPHDSHEFPVSTLVINVVGSFLLGLLIATPSPRVPDDVRLGLTTGLLGTFTTLSAVALSLTLLVDGDRSAVAVAYAAVTLVAGLAAAYAGFVLGERRGGRA